MTPADAAKLLTIAAAYDNRKPDADQAKAWAMALDGIRYEDARDAIVGHYQKTRDWLMPSDVITGAKRIRSDRLRAFGPIPDPPKSLDPADVDAYGQWLAETMRRIADGEMVAEAPAIASAPMPPELAAGMGKFGRELPRRNTTSPEVAAQAIRRAREALRPKTEEQA